MRPRALLLFVTPVVLAACSSGAGDGRPAREPVPAASSAAPNQGPKRVALSRALLEESGLTLNDVPLLQLYLRGALLLRREATAGAREVTKQHTLRIVEGQSYDEVLVDAGTPGMCLRAQQQSVLVNFDPEDPEATLEFEVGPEDRFKVRGEPDTQGRGSEVKYDGESYRVVQGSSAYLEIDAERLHALARKQRKLPGTLLPPSDSATGEGGAAP